MPSENQCYEKEVVIKVHFCGVAHDFSESNKHNSGAHVCMCLPMQLSLTNNQLVDQHMILPGFELNL